MAQIPASIIHIPVSALLDPDPVRMDGRTDSPCVLQDFFPFWAAALLPLFDFTNEPFKQGMDAADHTLPLVYH